MNSSLKHGLFSSMLFKFQIFGEFVDILWLISTLTLSWSDNIFPIASIFEIVMVLFYGPESGLSWWMFYMSLIRMCILILLILRVLLISIKSCWLIKAWFFLSPFLPVTQKGAEVSNSDCGLIYFSLYFWPFFSHAVWCPIRCTYI